MFDSRKILFVCLLPCSVICLTSEEIRAKPGDNVILQCRGPREGVIQLLEWSKPDLKSEDFVFYFRDERFYEEYQHPLFRGRMELRDPQMKEGDCSVILKNVTIKDTGTYVCHFENTENGPQLITITLTIRDSGDGGGDTEDGGKKDGRVGMIVGLSVVSVLVVVGAAALMIFRKHHGQNLHQPSPPQTRSPLVSATGAETGAETGTDTAV
ncbi:T-cell surface protein tactile Cell surface antigen CD96 [Channa argus]|uniref:T-cell surface protein tactile Cell surface antigen CD96 n=1 Tax=Channa argus TaxID=215402 RepID=A0A6G1Q6N0_CHAAH|nr:T-cell surface protein tactile Cell surface antigen CD96 [Channa argus]